MRTFPKGIVIIGLAVGLLVFALHNVSAQSAELTPQKLTDIKTTCINMQVVLQKIQYNDAANRVNRGQGYESLLARTIIPMNSRVAGNGLSSSTAVLADITTRYQQSFDTFKTDYEKYDDALTAALKVKCQQKPAEFYGHLTEARAQRDNLSNDIVTLGRLIEEYRQAVIKLKAGL